MMKKYLFGYLLFIVLFLSGCTLGNSIVETTIGMTNQTTACATEPTAVPPSTQATLIPPATTAPLPENPPAECKAKLTSLILSAQDNPAIAQDLHFTIDEDNLKAELTVDYQQYADLATLSSAVLRGSAENGTMGFDQVAVNGRVNLLNSPSLVVTDADGNGKDYQLIVHRQVYQLPIINITLDDGVTVDKIDRNLTTPMTISIDCTGADGFKSLESVGGKIRGRGNSTWTWDKKPYKIKLDKAAALLGLDENRDWILLANYADKSLLRNTVAYEMGKVLDGLFWTPTQYPVDLFINGVYQGVYGFGEHMEVSNGRVDIEESTAVNTDYFLEIGGMALTGEYEDKDYFHSSGRLIRFATYKSPDVSVITEAQKAYIIDYFNRAESAIIDGEGYEEFIDVNSFIDWIIIHELTYNIDSCFRRSCFMVKERDGKIKMGPIWDFDLALGNFSRDKKEYDNLITPGEGTDDAYIQANWCTYLLQDPAFCERLYERWQEVRDDLLEVAFSTITDYSGLLNGSQQENFAVWQIWDERAGYQSKWCSAANTYEKQIQYLRDFITKRAIWMDKNLPR